MPTREEIAIDKELYNGKNENGTSELQLKAVKAITEQLKALSININEDIKNLLAFFARPSRRTLTEGSDEESDGYFYESGSNSFDRRAVKVYLDWENTPPIDIKGALARLAKEIYEELNDDIYRAFNDHISEEYKLLEDTIESLKQVYTNDSKTLDRKSSCRIS